MGWVNVGRIKGDTGNTPVATAIQNLSNQIGTITSVQQSNLTLLGS